MIQWKVTPQGDLIINSQLGRSQWVVQASARCMQKRLQTVTNKSGDKNVCKRSEGFQYNIHIRKWVRFRVRARFRTTSERRVKEGRRPGALGDVVCFCYLNVLMCFA